ncbi:MAG TPA: patatin-like phospholipase family protein [Casimicrobiaceae bacterium]|jgi:NTE family protein|nr:patatin-like phospholipase family protein [Casimicrobiaceae bacterium]
MPSPVDPTALILSGGGARAAYQVGALRALARLVKRGSPLPFPILCGTSAGAINAATLAIHADDFRRGVARLIRWWRRIRVPHVYRADLTSLSRHGMRWLADVLIGRTGPDEAAAMLDNSPLGQLLREAIDFARVDDRLRDGTLTALAINATSYSTGFAITFFAGGPSASPWRRLRREGRAAKLSVDHLLASTAIPFVFPAVRLDGDWFMDGSVRQLTPLSPALHLGARRVLVLAVGQFAGQRDAPPPQPGYPSFAQTAGHALSSIFLDNLGADLERLQQLNRLASVVPADEVARRGLKIGHVDALVIAPTRDLGETALRYADQLPAGVRYLLRGFGSTRGTGANLTSYLLFQPGFVRALLALGYADAMARRDEVDAFLTAGASGFVPIVPRDVD